MPDRLQVSLVLRLWLWKRCGCDLYTTYFRVPISDSEKASMLVLSTDISRDSILERMYSPREVHLVHLIGSLLTILISSWRTSVIIFSTTLAGL